MATCSHCGKDYGDTVIAKHARSCVRNPKVRDAIFSCLRDPQNSAHAISAERYNARRVMFGAPADRTVSDQYGGKWEAVYTDFGLLRPLVYDRMLNRVTCPHCEQEFATGVYDRHTALCPKKPAYYDAIRAALQDADYPEFAVAQQDYHERARVAEVVGVDLLKRIFGTWRAAVDYFGLKPASSDELQQRRAMAEVFETAAREAAILREDAERAMVFTVCRVRELPGVTVNGRACVAMELR